ncbi:MAG: tetratricopeptide repeat protein [Acidobacteria bacterium]|nr:tetratricopeptide repeat protein [Acidobacteriota bacterium]
MSHFCLAAILVAGLPLAVSAAIAADPAVELRQALEQLAADEAARAESSLQGIVEQHGDYWPAALELGRLRLRQRRVAEAIPPLETAARLAPDEYGTRSLLGQAYALADRYPDAEREFLVALAVKPGDFQTLYNLGRLYRLQERYKESRKRLQEALELVPTPSDLPRVHQNLAVVLLALGRRSESLPHLQAFLEARPDRHALRLQLANTQFELSLYGEALDSVEHVLASGITEPSAHYLKGMLCKIKTRNEEAIAAFRAALKANPDFTRARYQLAVMLVEESRYEEAQTLLQQVLESEPNHPNAHYVLSSVLRRLGNVADADAEVAIHNRLAEQQRARGRTVVAGEN